MRWLRLLDLALGVMDATRRAPSRGEPDPAAAADAGSGDERAWRAERERMDMERERFNAERERAERLLKIDQQRHAGELEIARLRFMAAVATASLVGSLLFFAQVVSALFAALRFSTRAMMFGGWILFLAAIALSFSGQRRVARATERAGEADARPSSGPAGSVVPWLVSAGLLLIGLAAFTL